MKQLLSIAIALMFSFFASATDTTTVNVSLSAGENIKTDSIKVIDKVTGSEINASISSVSIQNSNPSAASVTYLSRVVKITRVSAGSGTAILSCRVGYVDAGDGLQKNEDKVIVINYTILGEPNGVILSLSF